MENDPSPAALMPLVFVGHGTPMNAIENNEFSLGWRRVAAAIPRPKAVLCISAHWETEGTKVTAMKTPRTIHDFGGFPQELFDVVYPAKGSSRLAKEAAKALGLPESGLDDSWGLDHGCWSVLRQMYPAADVPVVQLSLDYTLRPQEHYALAKALAPLREEGILVLGSGNMVHNLGMIAFSGGGIDDFNRPFGYDWAAEANGLFKKLILADRHDELTRYESLGKAVRLSVPTAEHFLPLLYVLALKQTGEPLSFFNDKTVGGSLSMTSLLISRSASL